MEVNPAVIIAIGAHAADVIDCAQKLLLTRLQLDSMPEVFKFLTLDPLVDSEEIIVNAYHAAANKAAASVVQEKTNLRVNSSRVESLLITTLHDSFRDATIQAAQTLRTCSSRVIAGGRNAIFLVPPKRSSDDFADLPKAAFAMDAEIRAKKSFHRCFIVDEVDERGRTMEKEETTEFVAMFVSLIVASELSRLLRNNPPPYIGEGSFNYSSFGCTTVTFNCKRTANLLSDYLCQDIIQNLFTAPKLNIEETDWPQLVTGLVVDTKEPVTSNAGDPIDIRKDPDFIKAKKKLDEVFESAFRSAGKNLNEFQRRINYYLHESTKRLELIRKDLITTRTSINQIEIALLLNRPCGTMDAPVHIRLQPPWLIITILSIIGVTLVTLALFLDSFQQEPYRSIGLGGGVFLTLAAIVLAIVNRNNVQTLNQSTPVSCEEELKRLKRHYLQADKRLQVQVALFLYLDLAYANFENLRKVVLEPGARPESSFFGLDLIDGDRVKQFYHREYKFRDSDIATFLEGQYLTKVYQNAFSFFELKLSEHLRQYCRQRFENLRSFDLDQILGFDGRLNRYEQLQTGLSPFWYPRDSGDSEISIFAIVPEDAPTKVRDLIDDAFGDRNITYVTSQILGEATILQIAFGQRLDNIFWNRPSLSTTH